MNDHKDPLIVQLERIADALERLVSGNKPGAPDIVRPIDQYAAFDWSSIDAEVVKADDDGPTHVSHKGRLFTRRSPQNKFDPAIWYSTPAGKDDEGNVQYLRLITFKTIADAEPLPRKLSSDARPAVAAKPEPVSNPPESEDRLAIYRAEAARKGVSPDAAAAILKEAGDDPRKAEHYLAYFVSAKAAGLKFSAAVELFRQSGSDVQFAIKALPVKKE